MKRSEMVDLMYQFMCDAAGEVGTDFVDAKDISELLSKMEDAGMLPAPIKLSTPDGEARLYAWEPECSHCGSFKTPLQKLGGLICADCRKML